MIWGNSKILEIGSPPFSKSIEKITLRPKKGKWYLLRQKVNLWISLSYKVWWIEHISRFDTGSATFIDDNHLFAHLRISLKTPIWCQPLILMMTWYLAIRENGICLEEAAGVSEDTMTNVVSSFKPHQSAPQERKWGFEGKTRRGLIMPQNLRFLSWLLTG